MVGDFRVENNVITHLDTMDSLPANTLRYNSC